MNRVPSSVKPYFNYKQLVNSKSLDERAATSQQTGIFDKRRNAGSAIVKKKPPGIDTGHDQPESFYQRQTP